MNCAQDACNEWPNYWWITAGKRIGYCFGHATVREKVSGRRERKQRP